MRSRSFRRITRLSVAMLMGGAAVAAQGQQIAFTWDDLPAHSSLPPGETRAGIGKKIIAAMRDEHMPPAYGFVNASQMASEPLSGPMLKEWREAGLPLGNHTWSHMNLNQHSASEWEADVLKNEPLLKSYMKDGDWHWLRYPYLAEGDTPEKRQEARAFLESHGYRIAGVTMSFNDYLFNEPYARCVEKKDTAAIAQLEESYLKAAEETIDYTRSMSKTLFGSDIPYVLLMHVGAFDARMLPRLLRLYRDKGFTFVTLEQAQQDPFYKSDMSLSSAETPDSLEGAMRARNLQPPPRPMPTMNLDAICR
jgi:peptidoglycan-N-acetylglucosamine deacetylase